MTFSWLDLLARDFEADPTGFAYGLSQALHEQLAGEGMDPVAASRIALRASRLAVLLLARYPQRQAGGLLGVSDRRAKHDAQRVRRVVQARSLSGYHGRRVPRLRVADHDRIVVSEPPSSRR